MTSASGVNGRRWHQQEALASAEGVGIVERLRRKASASAEDVGGKRWREAL